MEDNSEFSVPAVASVYSVAAAVPSVTVSSMDVDTNVVSGVLGSKIGESIGA